MAEARRDLIKGLWPDKALYGATLLFITGILGVLHGLAFSLVTLGEELPDLVRTYPPEATLLFSAASMLFAWLALRRQDSRLAIVGAISGFLSFALLGLGSVLAAIAFIFILLSRGEGEDANPETAELSADMWPDKALAASVVILVAGVLTAGWGYVLMTSDFAFEGYMDRDAFAWLNLAIGAVCMLAAVLLYRQRAPVVGLLASLGAVAGLGLYVVAPILGLVTLVLILQAWREDEFAAHAVAG